MSMLVNPRGQPKSHLYVLFGPSGVGKTTILRYLEQNADIDTVPKYTTRPSRGTEDDARDFIFCGRGEFPVEGILRFESYGHSFGIQLDKIDASLAKGNSHAVIVGGNDVVKRLSSIYTDNTVPVFIFCRSSVLKNRILNDTASQRKERWPQIREELVNIYDQLDCVQFIINNSGTEKSTFLQVDELLSIF